ncbi:MAG: hypothetical protein AB7K41_15365 [Bdellovibrionales bacterium]
MKVYFVIEADLSAWLVDSRPGRMVRADEIKDTLENNIEGTLEGFAIEWHVKSFFNGRYD